MVNPNLLQPRETELPYGFETVSGMENTHDILTAHGSQTAEILIATLRNRGDLVTYAPINGSMTSVYFTLRSLYESHQTGELSADEYNQICSSFRFIDVKGAKSDNPIIYPEDLQPTSLPIVAEEDIADEFNTFKAIKKRLSLNGDVIMVADVFKELENRPDEDDEYITNTEYSKKVPNVWIWSGCGMNRGLPSPDEKGAVQEAYLTALQRVCSMGVYLPDGKSFPLYEEQVSFFAKNTIPEFTPESPLFHKLVEIDYWKSVGEHYQALAEAQNMFELMRAMVEGRTIA